MTNIFIRNNINNISIIIFVILYSLIVYSKPAFLFNHDGSIKHFGIGYSDKTIVPFWLISYILGIFSYLSVLYVITFPRLQY